MRTIRFWGLEFSEGCWHDAVMTMSPKELSRNRLKVGAIALGLFTLGSQGPGLDSLFGHHGPDMQFDVTDSIDRAAAAADRAAALADQALEDADRAAEQATLDADEATRAADRLQIDL